MNLFTANFFFQHATDAIAGSKQFNTLQFRSHFGVAPIHCEKIWSLICIQNKSHDLQPKYLLWSLIFLKIYSTEEVHCRMAQVTRKTFRFWSWRTIKIIADLKIVSTYFFDTYYI